MQVTPDWFWARTALGDTVNSELRSAVPAVVNHRYRWDARALGAGAISIEESDTLLRMPAITLTAGAVGRFAGLVAGVGREWAPGVVFDLAWQALEPEENGAPAPAIDAAERVARFGTLASRAAQRLAAAFAASPVRTLGVLRLLRRDLVPDAGPFTEAEVMLGGILRVRREDAQWESGVSLPLEFVPGVQPLLLDGAIAGDVIRVLTHAAAVAESGVGPTFTSWLTNPSSGTALLDPAESAFAASAAQVLERLGGTYAQIVKPGSRRPLDDAIGIAQRQEEDPPRDPLDGDDDRVMSVEFVINGRVQGVGFRYFGQQQANELGLEGDVRNLPDGRVRMHARGPRSRLKELQNRLRQGPPGSTVHDLVTTVLPEPVRVAWGGADRAVVAIGISRVGGLPRLDSAPAAARKVADWALASQGIPADSVTLLTDDDGAVEAKQIVHAVRSAIEAGHTRQLVLYFCGYAISVNRDEHWLLSNAPEDPNAAVNLHASVALARYAGIPHVVFISDTCRVSPESVGARVVGGEIFPSMSSERPCDVDQFYAVGGWQKPLDVKMEAVASQSRAAYTEVLLSALGGGVPSLLEEEEGVRFVRPQTLARYLETAMREHMSSQNVPIQLAQQPDARIESDRGAWLAAFADPTRRGRMDIQA
jgi:acylphosphatase